MISVPQSQTMRFHHSQYGQQEWLQRPVTLPVYMRNVNVVLRWIWKYPKLSFIVTLWSFEVTLLSSSLLMSTFSVLLNTLCVSLRSKTLSTHMTTHILEMWQDATHCEMKNKLAALLRLKSLSVVWCGEAGRGSIQFYQLSIRALCDTTSTSYRDLNKETYKTENI